MIFETMEIWDAMKDVKYQRTLEDLQKVIRNAHGSLNEAISAALNMACTAVHAEAGTFWFYSRFGDGMIHPRAWYGGGDMKNVFLLPGEGVAGQVIEKGEHIMVVDCQSDPRWANKIDKNTGFSTKSMLCVPLIVDDMPFGCIQLINKTDGSLFDEKDLQFEMRLAEEIVEQFVTLNLLTDGRVEDEVAVLFVDIRGFTKLSEHMDPMQVAQMLNEYLFYVTDRIKRNGGIPDKYIGDCAMAYWRISETCTDPAYMACRAAMEMVDGMADLQKRLKKKFGCNVSFGVGVSFGPAFVGSIGTSVLTDHTVVGMTVNTASWLESKAPAGKVYITKSAADALGNRAKTSKVNFGLKLKKNHNESETYWLEHIF